MRYDIAIHDSGTGFTKHWINFCENNNLPYKLIDCFDNNIINQASNFKFLLWHFSQNDYKDMLLARSILQSIQKMGVKVFPDYDTSWHFDDKVAQKYLLESIGAPVVNSYVFCTKKSALEWIENSSFPLVFKLSGGASSSNVRLVRTKKQAIKLINRCFFKGWPSVNATHRLKESIRTLSFSNIDKIIKALIRFIIPADNAKFLPRHVGYVYFQDFIPNNDYDIRVIVIGKELLQ